MLLGALTHGCRRGLLCGLRRGVPNGSNRLGCPLASNVVRVDVQCRTNYKTTLNNVKNSNKMQNITVRK